MPQIQQVTIAMKVLVIFLTYMGLALPHVMKGGMVIANTHLIIHVHIFFLVNVLLMFLYFYTSFHNLCHHGLKIALCYFGIITNATK